MKCSFVKCSFVCLFACLFVCWLAALSEVNFVFVRCSLPFVGNYVELSRCAMCFVCLYVCLFVRFVLFCFVLFVLFCFVVFCCVVFCFVIFCFGFLSACLFV